MLTQQLFFSFSFFFSRSSFFGFSFFFSRSSFFSFLFFFSFSFLSFSFSSFLSFSFAAFLVFSFFQPRVSFGFFSFFVIFSLLCSFVFFSFFSSFSVSNTFTGNYSSAELVEDNLNRTNSIVVTWDTVCNVIWVDDGIATTWIPVIYFFDCMCSLLMSTTTILLVDAEGQRYRRERSQLFFRRIWEASFSSELRLPLFFLFS